MIFHRGSRPAPHGRLRRGHRQPSGCSKDHWLVGEGGGVLVVSLAQCYGCQLGLARGRGVCGGVNRQNAEEDSSPSVSEPSASL